MTSAIVQRGIAAYFLSLIASAPLSADPGQIYNVSYVVTPGNVMVNALHDESVKQPKCPTIDASATTPEIVKTSGGVLQGWAFVNGKALGYVTWVIEKSGIHTVFVANYVLGNCSLTEMRTDQRSFDGPNRNAIANAAYNRLITETMNGKVP